MAQPYLTADEYLNAPTGTDTTSLVTDGLEADQASELTRIIARASAWIDNVCNQSLVASIRTEWHTVRYDRRGRLKIKPDNWPLVSLDSLEVGTHAADLRPVGDLSGVWAERQTFTVPGAAGGSFLTVGFPWSARGDLAGEVLTRITYVAGYPNTTLTVAGNAGDNALEVASAAGIVAGETLTVGATSHAEQVQVASVSGQTVTLAGPLVQSHIVGGAVHDMPQDVKAAAILATSSFINDQGSEALSLSMTSAAATGPDRMPDPTGSAQRRAAAAILASYARVL